MAAVQDDVIVATVIHDNPVSGEQQNRYQFQLQSSEPIDDATLLDDIALIIETIYVIVEGLISLRNVLREVKVFNLTKDLLIGATDGGDYIGGTLTGDDLPQAVAPFAYFPTSVPNVVMSKYLPSGTEVVSDADGKLTAAGLNALTSFAGTLMAAHGTGEGLYEYGYFSPKVATFVQPVSFVVSNVLAYQRRRKPGRGA